MNKLSRRTAIFPRQVANFRYSNTQFNCWNGKKMAAFDRITFQLETVASARALIPCSILRSILKAMGSVNTRHIKVLLKFEA